MEIHEKLAMNEKIAEIRGRSAYWLSGNDMADCMSPDNADSAGGKFLVSVRDETCDKLEEIVTEFFAVDDFDTIDDDGTLHEIADAAPSIWTSEKWAQFTDLGAYAEDLDDGPYQGVTEMDRLGGIALYMIAERLANAIVAEVREAVENAELPDEDEATE